MSLNMIADGIKILAKYYDPCVGAADHDIIYGPSPESTDLDSDDNPIDPLISAEDHAKLKDLDWYIDDDCWVHSL